MLERKIEWHVGQHVASTKWFANGIIKSIDEEYEVIIIVFDDGFEQSFDYYSEEIFPLARLDTLDI